MVNHILSYMILFHIDSILVLSAISISQWLLNPHSSLFDSLRILRLVLFLFSYHMMAYIFHLHNRIWSVASTGELLNVTNAVTIPVILSGLIHLFVEGDFYVREMIVTLLLLINLIGCSRFLFRLVHDRMFFEHIGELKRVLVQVKLEPC